MRVELKKRYPHEFRERVSEEMTLRREAIRKFKLFTMASNHIQAVFRGYLARKAVWLMKELIRLEKFESDMKKEVEHSGIWWTNREEIPARRMLPYNTANSMGVAELETPETVGVLQKLKGGEKGVSLKLPAIPIEAIRQKERSQDYEGLGSH